MGKRRQKEKEERKKRREKAKRIKSKYAAMLPFFHKTKKSPLVNKFRVGREEGTVSVETPEKSHGVKTQKQSKDTKPIRVRLIIFRYVFVADSMMCCSIFSFPFSLFSFFAYSVSMRPVFISLCCSLLASLLGCFNGFRLVLNVRALVD